MYCFLVAFGCLLMIFVGHLPRMGAFEWLYILYLLCFFPFFMFYFPFSFHFFSWFCGLSPNADIVCSKRGGAATCLMANIFIFIFIHYFVFLFCVLPWLALISCALV